MTTISAGYSGTMSAFTIRNEELVPSGSVTLGFSISNLHKADKRRNYLIGAEFNYSDWSTYRSYGNIDSMHKSYSIRVGGFYKPWKTYRNDYFNRVEYRAGAHYTRTPLMIKSTAIDEYGVAVGLGLPMYLKGHISALINVAFEAGKMGSVKNGLTADNYYRLSLGFNFSSEDWFHRYKYD